MKSDVHGEGHKKYDKHLGRVNNFCILVHQILPIIQWIPSCKRNAQLTSRIQSASNIPGLETLCMRINGNLCNRGKILAGITCVQTILISSYGMSSLHGYQWVFVSIFIWQFPWGNQHAECMEVWKKEELFHNFDHLCFVMKLNFWTNKWITVQILLYIF